MVNNLSRLFLCLVLLNYTTSAVGYQEMPEEYIVTINNIKMYRSVAERIFWYVSSSYDCGIAVAHDAKDKSLPVTTVQEGMDVVIEDNFMVTVAKLYQNCLTGKDTSKVDEGRACARSCGEFKCVDLCIDKKEKLIVSLIIY